MRVNGPTPHIGIQSRDRTAPRDPPIYPVIVANHFDRVQFTDSTRAAARPAGITLVLIDETLDPTEASNAIARTAMAFGCTLPAALMVQQDFTGQVEVRRAHLAIPQMVQVVRTVCEEPDDPSATPETEG